MSTLKIISQDMPAAVYTLTPGTVSVGRHEDNQVQISHPTVSSHHCELQLADGHLVVRDLHSTNGTFINDQPLKSEAVLEGGNVLRLGDVRLLYESVARARVHVTLPAANSAAPVSEPATAPEPTAAVQLPCHRHPAVEGSFVCTQCTTVFCEHCVSKRAVAGKTSTYCSLCSSKAVPLGAFREQQQAKVAYENLTFPQRLRGILAYPLAKGGLLFLAAGAFILWLVDLARMVVKYVPFYGWTALIILLVFSWGWLFSYTQKIIVASSRDEDLLPDWPEITEWSSDLVQPFFACLGTLALCFVPAVAYSIFAAANDMAPSFFYPLYLMGAVYFPMAVLVVSLTGRILSANPFVVLPAMVKAPRDYFILCVFFVGALGIWNGLWMLVDWFGPEPTGRGAFVSTAIWKGAWSLPLGFIFIYLMVVCARAAGLMYRCNWRKFGWFKH